MKDIIVNANDLHTAMQYVPFYAESLYSVTVEIATPDETFNGYMPQLVLKFSKNPTGWKTVGKEFSKVAVLCDGFNSEL